VPGKPHQQQQQQHQQQRPWFSFADAVENTGGSAIDDDEAPPQDPDEATIAEKQFLSK